MKKKCSKTCLKISKLFFKNLQIFLENLSDIILKNGQVLSIILSGNLAQKNNSLNPSFFKAKQKLQPRQEKQNANVKRPMITLAKRPRLEHKKIRN